MPRTMERAARRSPAQEGITILLGDDGRHVLLGRHSEPDGDELAKIAALLASMGVGAWVARMSGDYWHRGRRVRLEMVREAAPTAIPFETAVEAFRPAAWAQRRPDLSRARRVIRARWPSGGDWTQPRPALASTPAQEARMASATLSIPGEAGRRSDTFAALITPELRAEISGRVDALHEGARRALDAAHFLIDFLDAADRPTLDMEPDAEGEPDPAEASTQPITLAPEWVRPVVVHRPSRAAMREAYRRNGDPIPANLRGLFGRAWA